jgi:hypothetical protein
MAVTIAFLEVPDLVGRVVQPGDISEGDANSLTIPLNRGGDIIEQAIAKRQFTFRVRGLSGAEITQLKGVSETNLTNLLAGTNPSLRTISFSGVSYPNCFLRSVKPSGSVTVGGFDVVDSSELIYETQDRYLV